MLGATLITFFQSKKLAALDVFNEGGESNNITGTSFSSHKKVRRPLWKGMKVVGNAVFIICCVSKQKWLLD